jgi:hypothetical protein
MLKPRTIGRHGKRSTSRLLWRPRMISTMNSSRTQRLIFCHHLKVVTTWVSKSLILRTNWAKPSKILSETYLKMRAQLSFKLRKTLQSLKLSLWTPIFLNCRSKLKRIGLRASRQSTQPFLTSSWASRLTRSSALNANHSLTSLRISTRSLCLFRTRRKLLFTSI